MLLSRLGCRAMSRVTNPRFMKGTQKEDLHGKDFEELVYSSAFERCQESRGTVDQEDVVDQLACLRKPKAR